jgi:hypothetical protein
MVLQGHGDQDRRPQQPPDCWDGVHIDDPVNHREPHGLLQRPGGLPRRGYGHEVPLLHLQLRYPLVGQNAITLSSGQGSRYSQHADFLNAWDQGRLQQLVDDCLNASVDCGVNPPPP